jgi:hypothetical protein
MEGPRRDCFGFIGVLETLCSRQPVEIFRGKRTTLIIGVGSTERSEAAEETSTETIQSVVLYARQYV